MACNQPSGYVDNASDTDDSEPYGAGIDCGTCTMQVVPPGEETSGDYTSIQDAIGAAPNGAVICVAEGHWTETLNFVGKDVEVCGTAGADDTIIDGDGVGPVVRFTSGESAAAILRGFTITGGDAADGAGIYIHQSSPTLQDLIIAENTCGGGGTGEECHGVGLYISQASMHASRLVVRDNIAYHEGTYGYQQSRGGGIYAISSTLDFSGLHVLDNIVQPHANQSSEYDGVVVYGGGLYAESTEATISDGMFVGNTVTGTMSWFEETAILGSALYLRSGAGLTMSNVLFADNVVDSSSFYSCAGTLYVNDTSLSLTNGIIANNTSSCGSLTGGIAYLSSATLSLSGVVLAGNTKLSSYDGSKETGGIASYSSSVTLRSCSFSDNIGNGSALYQNGGSLTATRNNFYGDMLFSGLSSPVGQQGNISVEPGFIDVSASSGVDWDLHLTTSSDLIDAGSSSYSDPDSSATDIGAYGGQGADDWDLDWDDSPSWWQPGPYDASYTKDNLDCDDQDSTVNATVGCP